MTNSGSESTPPKKRASRRQPRTSIFMHEFDIERGFTIQKTESPDEMRSRLSIEEAKAAHEIWRDKVILRCCLFAVPVLIVACLSVLLIPGGPVEARTWAASTLTAVVTGIVGYSLGKSGKAS
jgi:hypothetical protein